jgi:hypothetical protein
MIDSREPGGRIMKQEEADTAPSVRSGDEFVHITPTSPADTHVTTGSVLWTLAHNNSTAQARQWLTANGFELELQIWTGAHVSGQEDLCWSQLFPSETALVEAAVAKKRQLEASGWLEDLETAPRSAI